MAWNFPTFLPAHALQGNALLLFGCLLLAGLAGARLVAGNRWVPRLTGYLLVGVLIGASGLNWLSGEFLELASNFADLAVALIVYQLGRYVDLEWLRREKWVVATVLTTALLCFLLVNAALLALGLARPLANIAAVLAIGTSPGVVMVVIRDLKAEGHLTRRLAAMTALNNLIALLAAYLMLPLVASEARTSVLTLVSHTLYSLSGALLLAYLTHRLMLLLARWLGRARRRQFVLVVAVITLAIGAAHALQLPVLLTMLAFAILSKNLDREYDLMELEFGVATEVFIVLLFVAIGASIHLQALTGIGLAVAALIGARLLALGTGIFIFARPSRLNWRQAGLLTLGAAPMTENALGLIQISNLYPHLMAELAPLLAGVLIVLELIGPIATQFALIASGDAGHE